MGCGRTGATTCLEIVWRGGGGGPFCLSGAGAGSGLDLVVLSMTLGLWFLV